MFVIVCRGTQSNGVKVIWPSTGKIATFPTRKAARAYADSLVPDMPSKHLPLRVSEVI